jgi:hypothetical protein
MELLDKEYAVWGYDKDNDVWDEYYRGIDADTAKKIALEKTMDMESGNLVRVCSDGHKEPIDWVEVVETKAEYHRDYKEYVVWSSYDNFISKNDLICRLKDYELEGVEISEDDVLEANELALVNGKDAAIDQVLSGIADTLEEGYEDELDVADDEKLVR